MIITRLTITEGWVFGSGVSPLSVTNREQPWVKHKQSTTMVVGNGSEEQGAANASPRSHTVPQPLLPTPGETRKRFIGLSSAETPAKKRRYGPLSESFAQPIQLPPPPSCNRCNSLSSREPAQTRDNCAQGVALIPDKQLEKHNKEGKTSAQDTYSPVCRCDARVPKTWKAFVENESLVSLGEALCYLAASKLGDYDVCIGHRIRLALKLQLRQVDTLTLLTRVDTIWKNRDWETLRRFVNMRCRRKWWRFDGKVLFDEKAVTKFQIIRDRV